jgi:hypothetical protein
VPITHYNEVKVYKRKLRADALDTAKIEEERIRIREN